MGNKREYYLENEKLIEFKKLCKGMINAIEQVQEKRARLIEFTGLTDKEAQEIDSKINPEDYYSLKMFDKGVSIVYTNWYYNTETHTRYKNNKKYHYSIKYYNCRSNVFKDKDTGKGYIYSDNQYGYYETLDEAKSDFRKAIVDILVQFGNCKALNPMDFM